MGENKENIRGGGAMKIQVMAEDGMVLDTIEDVQDYLMSQYSMGNLLDKLLDIYKNKYAEYMYEKYQRDRRSGEERRHLSSE
jgi:hypothetical protein